MYIYIYIGWEGAQPDARASARAPRRRGSSGGRAGAPPPPKTPEAGPPATPCHHRGELRADLKSISHWCHLFEVEFVWKLTKTTINLPLGCLQGA